VNRIVFCSNSRVAPQKFTGKKWTAMFVDTNPFLFWGRVCGAMVRLSDSPIVHVTSGGGETGFFVIEA